MAKKNETEVGEQMPLINIGPKHSPQIKRAVARWKGIVTERIALQAKEAEAKEKAFTFFKAENLKRLDDGSIKCRCEGWLLKLEATDEKFTATKISE